MTWESAVASSLVSLRQLTENANICWWRCFCGDGGLETTADLCSLGRVSRTRLIVEGACWNFFRADGIHRRCAISVLAHLVPVGGRARLQRRQYLI